MNTPTVISREIFYSPATNGQAERSISKGAKMIEEYGRQFKSIWISVATPPEVGLEVMVYNNGEFDLATYKTTKAWRSTREGELLDLVTHWMPLPEPPTINQSI